MPSKDRIKIWLIGVLGALFLKAIHRTLRWQNLGKLADPQFWFDSEARILAFWHGRQLLMPFAKVDFERQKPLNVLISEHRDGRIIAAIVRRLGIDSVAGSSTRGGSQATRQLIAKLNSGAHIAITPDGPKGPIYCSKPGIIFLASLARKPIYPICYSAQKYWTFGSWDGMILPKPFSKAVRKVGNPIVVPPKISKEDVPRYQLILDEAMEELRRELDSYDYR